MGSDSSKQASGDAAAAASAAAVASKGDAAAKAAAAKAAASGETASGAVAAEASDAAAAGALGGDAAAPTDGEGEGGGGANAASELEQALPFAGTTRDADGKGCVPIWRQLLRGTALSCLAPPARKELEREDYQLEVTLLKPTPATKWGVMPGTLDGQVVVHALNPAGLAKQHLAVGDRIVAVDGAPIATEAEMVEKLNAAYDTATATSGPNLTLIRSVATPGGGGAPPAAGRGCLPPGWKKGGASLSKLSGTPRKEAGGPALIDQQMEVTLLKPTPATKWGVMPGTLDGHVVVHALNPAGLAKQHLAVGDRIVAVDGAPIATEAEMVEKLNAAYDTATATSGPKLTLIRSIPAPPDQSGAGSVVALAGLDDSVPRIEPPYTKLSLDVQERFLRLPQLGKVQAEYVWIGGRGELRCKTKTLDKLPATAADLPIWNFDGSSTEQAPGSDSEVLLKPCAFYPDPFRPGGDNVLVLCDCYAPDPDKPQGLGDAISTNTRAACKTVMDKVASAEPWFGIEQEYTLYEPDGTTPYGSGHGPQGPSYCAVGTGAAFGRPVAEAHYKACMYAGINISGVNDEVMPGQWEYQVGPCTGIESPDQLIMSRYLLIRVCEQFGVVVRIAQRARAFLIPR